MNWQESDLADYKARRAQETPRTPNGAANGAKTLPAAFPARETAYLERGKSAKRDVGGRKGEFELQCAFVGIPLEREFKFHSTRKWRADWRVAGTRILIEYEGGIFAREKR